MATITVQPTTLRWAVEQSDADLDEIVISKPKLGQLPDWLNSNEPLKLSFSNLEALSASLHVPFGTLVLTEPPQSHDEAIVKYRTLGNDNAHISQNLRDVLASMHAKQNWAHDELSNLGLGDNTLVGSARQTKSPQEIANLIKDQLSLKDDWPLGYDRRPARFNFLRDIVAKAGVLVMNDTMIGRRRLNLSEFRAFTLLDDVVPLIFINRNDSDSAMLFSLLHELVHVALGTEELFNDSEIPQSSADSERLINRTAMELVVPEHVFLNEWKLMARTHTADDIANRFSLKYGLSTIAFLIRARQLGLASEADIEQERNAMEQRLKSPRQSNDSKGGNQNLTNASHFDSRFVGLVRQSINSGTLPYTDGFALLNVKSSRAYDGLLKAKKMMP
ncbi:ImmA/IrrE family metallo-endopeptidase [Bifidobacterium bombi]|uniref:IrrE N-terminal-like domain-containing protein n=1 Tax=Bifidobacterium bombi DSM 19703 TaxID=1341695 RepID=A0A080N4U8_9BIFI|nr:ImmA/IrrE family metallo-endopeptidase [Bifidobacterium bombi]KFF31735.1 hypothetical protein BBOMB_1127 [Bifidobacterium bombi DSM 19703]